MIEVIVNIIAEATGEAEPKVTTPENSEFGHYSTNLAMIRAGLKETNPRKEAEEIMSEILKIAPKGFFSKLEIAGPGFINLHLSKETITKEAGNILKKKERYGASDTGKGKTIVIDYSAPNVAKPMSVGHLRSTVIGEAIANLLKFQGYKVISDNHLGDWGTQFGALIYAYKNWAQKEEFKKNPIEHLVSLYVRFHKEAEENKTLLDEARKETAKLQKKDAENTKLWKSFVRESLREFGKIYKRLGVKFDVTLGESFYEPDLKQIVDDALRLGIARKDEGAVKIFFGDDKLPPYVIEKADGSHLYTTTDLATVKYRVNKWHPKKILYVVANEQALHFAQLFEAVRLLGLAPETELQHIKFGMMLGASGKKFSTRKGEFIKLTELLDKAKESAAEINPSSAEEVGVGAVKYYDLSHYRLSDIVFDWDAMLSLKGNSAPYIQYTYARLRNIVKKAGRLKPKMDAKILLGEAEKKVLESLIRFSDIAAYAAEKCEPNHLAEYLFKMANALNAFYEASPVIKAEKKTAEARLALVVAGTIVLKSGLTLLGIELPKRM
ncbi:MAG: arginine--tRNA ligase [Parcubacteria group bacterium]